MISFEGYFEKSRFSTSEYYIDFNGTIFIFDSDTAEAIDDRFEYDTSWFDRAVVVRRSKQLVSLRLDPEILDYFRATGKNYQSRMNAVLLAYVEHRKEQERPGDG